MKVYGAVAVILGYLIMGGSAAADDKVESYVVSAVYLYHECHVLQPDDAQDTGLDQLAGPFSSKAEACKAAANLYDADKEDTSECWRYGTFTPRKCAEVGVTLPGK